MNISHLGKPELADHLLANPDHNITWKILRKAPAKRKFKPTNNSQNENKITHIFKNGIK